MGNVGTAKTERGRYRATVKETASGQPFIVFELLSGPEIPALKNALVALDLRQGTTYAQAQELAGQLHKFVDGMALTSWR